MNISTYEARIAALEAQLGPGPGPGPEPSDFGLEYIEISPNNSTTAGKTIKESVDEALPLLAVTDPQEGLPPDDLELVFSSAQLANANYSISIKPKSDCYAVLVAYGDENPHFSEMPGDTLSGYALINVNIDEEKQFIIGCTDSTNFAEATKVSMLNVIFSVE